MVDMKSFSDEIDSMGLTESYICKVEQCTDLLSTRVSSIKILHINIRSVNQNFDELVVFLNAIRIRPDIIVLSECWLSKVLNIPTLDGYVTYKTNNNFNQNSGLILYVVSTLTPVISEPYTNSSNCLICKIESANLVVLALYRPPSCRDVNPFLDFLNTTLSSLSSIKNILIIGDININIMPTNLDKQASAYLNLTASHGLLPMHNYPTREKNCLDHILLKSLLKTKTLIFDTCITDHAPIFIQLQLNLKQSKSTSVYVKVDYPSVYRDISNTDFSTVMTTLDPNLAAEKLITIIRSTIPTFTNNAHFL